MSIIMLFILKNNNNILKIQVHMVNLALEQVDTGRKRKAEQNQGSGDDDDLFGQLTIIRPNHVEMPVFTFLDDD